jgi:hypothetical protein
MFYEQKHPFFTLDVVAYLVIITVCSSQNFEEEKTLILKVKSLVIYLKYLG